MPTDALTRHYDAIAQATHAVREQALADANRVDAAHAAIEEIKIWQHILEARPEAAIFTQIISALELGLFALVSGLYRQAHGSLRLAVELTAGMAWFSTHRLDLAEWQRGERDLVWKEIMNIDEGVLSPRYRKAFFPELNEEKRYQGLYTKLYRELSENVHGNARTWTGADDIRFVRELHEKWFQYLETFMMVMTVLLSLRYLQEIGTGDLEGLQPILRARVPFVAAITKYLDEKFPVPEPRDSPAAANLITALDEAPPHAIQEVSAPVSEHVAHDAQKNADMTKPEQPD